MTVKVAREAVDQIVNGSTVIFQMFDDLPVNQARMRTDFGYVLKTFGEAEVHVAQDGPGALVQKLEIRD